MEAIEYIKHLIPNLQAAIKYYHVKEEHAGSFDNCIDILCMSNRELNSRIDADLFQGKLTDLTGVTT